MVHPARPSVGARHLDDRVRLPALAVCFASLRLTHRYHHQIITWLRPFADKVADFKGGWAIIIAIFFVISFVS